MALSSSSFCKMSRLQGQVKLQNVLCQVRRQGLASSTTTTGDDASKVTHKTQFRKDGEFEEHLRQYRSALQNAPPTKYETMALLWCGYFDTPDDIPERVSTTMIYKARHKVSVLFNMWMLCTLFFAGFTFVALQRARFEKIRKSALKRQLAHFAEMNKKYDEEYAEKKRLRELEKAKGK